MWFGNLEEVGFVVWNEWKIIGGIYVIVCDGEESLMKFSRVEYEVNSVLVLNFVVFFIFNGLYNCRNFIID